MSCGAVASVPLGVRDLLAEQLIALQRAMTLSEELVKCIAAEGAGVGVEGLVQRCRRERGVEDRELFFDADLKRPLLDGSGACAVREVASRQSEQPFKSLLWDLAFRDDDFCRKRALEIGAQCRLAAARLQALKFGQPSGGDGRDASNDQASHPGGPSLIPNPDELKRDMRAFIKTQAACNVEDLYKKEGRWQAIARNRWFKQLTFAMILFSTFWIAIDTDYNKATVLSDALPVFQIVNNGICVFFLLEIVVRWMAFDQKVKAFFDMPFVFDLCLVVLMVVETWLELALQLLTGSSAGLPGGPNLASAFRSLRIFRNLRMLRMGRLLRAMPELMILINSMGYALRSVVTTMVLLLLVTFAFATFLTQLLNGVPGQVNFSSVETATNFLFLEVLCGFNGDFITSLLPVSIVAYCIMMVYVFIASFTLMNLLIGMLVAIVSTEATQEHERKASMLLEDDILRIVASSRGDSTSVTKDDFKRIINCQEMVQRLFEGGVDVLGLVDCADFLFRDVDALSLDDFVRLVQQFRGSNQANVGLRVLLCQELVRMRPSGLGSQN